MAKKALIIVSQRAFNENVILTIQKELSQNKVGVELASDSRGLIQGIAGQEIELDIAVGEVEPRDYQAVVVVCDVDGLQYCMSEDVLRVLKVFNAAGKVIAGIDFGPRTLANAGVLLSKKATGQSSTEQFLKDRGAEYTGMPAQADGRVITAKEPAAVKEFANLLVMAIGV